MTTKPFLTPTTGALAGRSSLGMFQDWSAHANGSISGDTTTYGGLTWQVTGGNVPVVTSGYLYSPGPSKGYACVDCPSQPRVITCEVAFGGFGTDLPMTMALCANTFASGNILQKAVHFNFGPAGFTLTLLDAADTSRQFKVIGGLSSAKWRRPCKVDGTTLYRFSMMIKGNTVHLIGPNGEKFAVTDERVSSFAGPTAFWEPTTETSTIGKLRTAGLVFVAATGRGGQHDLILETAGGRHTDYANRVVGSAGGYGERSSGLDPTAGCPGDQYGYTLGYATLTSDAASGATSIVTDEKIPNGSTIVIGTGATAESITSSAASTGSGPYTTTVSALANAHAALTVCQITPTSTRHCTSYFNPENSTYYLPDSTSLAVRSTNGIFLSSGLTTGLKEQASSTNVPAGVAVVTKGMRFSTTGAIMTSGVGAPTGPGSVGDLYDRVDGSAGSYRYRCTTAGAAGSAVWTAIL